MSRETFIKCAKRLNHKPQQTLLWDCKAVRWKSKKLRKKETIKLHTCCHGETAGWKSTAGQMHFYQWVLQAVCAVCHHPCCHTESQCPSSQIPRWHRFQVWWTWVCNNNQENSYSSERKIVWISQTQIFMLKSIYTPVLIVPYYLSNCEVWSQVFCGW